MRKHDWSWLVQRLRASWKLQLVAITCGVIASTLFLIDPLLMKWLIDSVLPHRNVVQLGFVVAGVLGTYVGRVFFQNRASLSIFAIGQKLSLTLRTELFAHLEKLMPRFYAEHSIGDLVQRLDGDVDVICELGADLIPALLRITLNLGFVVVTMFLLSWRLASLLLPLLPLFLFVRYRYRGPLQRASDEVREATGRQSTLLTEFLGAMLQIQLLCCERRVARRYLHSLAGTIRAAARRRKTEIEFAAVSMLVVTAGGMMVLGYGGYLVIRGLLTIGSLVAFYGFVLRLFEPLGTAIELMARLHRIRASVRRLMALRGRVPDVTDRPGAKPLVAHGEWALSYRQVCFDYDRETPLIHNATLQVFSGEIVFIVGSSGSGKSTLIKLLCRLHDVSEGRIELNGMDIRDVTLASLRCNVSAVPQEPVIFSASVRENLLLARPDATQEQLLRAAEVACLTDVIRTLPGGWDEVLGPLGCRLSGGERQRVALARALLQERPILILDEATSALDSQTEARVLARIREYASRRILLIVSHRITSAPLADRVIVMDHGRIVEQGSHAELVGKGTRYSSLWKHAKEQTAETDADFSVLEVKQRGPAEEAETEEPYMIPVAAGTQSSS